MMIMHYFDIFLTGAFTIIFLYFMTLFIFSPAEKYYLFFALMCLVEAIRITILNIAINDSTSLIGLFLYKNLGSLTFIWFPYIYVMVAHSLFDGIAHKAVLKALLLYHIVISLLMVFVFIPNYGYPSVLDYVIGIFMGYATYIFTVALIRGKRFAWAMFIANLLAIGVSAHDLLLGSKVITSAVGELSPYLLFIYLYMVSVVLAKKHSLINEAHFKSQMKFLQAQIEPHFLYNTISTIRACCRTDAEKSRELLGYFSVYLRGKFKSGDELFAPLMEEIELVKAYLAIEQVRFDHRLTVEYDIDENCDVLVPCLIIQPIVENAVKHGLYPKKEGGEITIRIKRIEDNIIITISDNGTGMEEARISEVLNYAAQGIGISNTNERLKQYYGTEIKMQHTPGGGTTVILTIPLKYQALSSL